MLNEIYFGVTNSPVKSRLVAHNKFRIIKVKVDTLSYDCIRHIDVLNRYERGEDLFQGVYVEYNLYYSSAVAPLRPPPKTIVDIRLEIEGFIHLYETIKRNGYLQDQYITVTSNRARLDGSHRMAILKVLGVPEIEVKEIYAPKLFLHIVGREVRKKRNIFSAYQNKIAYCRDTRQYLGKVLYTDYACHDILSLRGTYSHVLDSGKLVEVEKCFLKEK